MFTLCSFLINFRLCSMLFHTQSPWGAVAVAKQKFFDERTDQSEVKARIVQKYFYAWANVIIPTAKRFDKKIAYIDLYAGPGRYEAANESRLS